MESSSAPPNHTLSGRGETKAYALLNLSFPSEIRSKILYKLLTPEVRSPATSRTSVKLKSSGKAGLKFEFKASDTTALRAAINSYIRWIIAACEALSTVDSLSDERF